MYWQSFEKKIVVGGVKWPYPGAKHMVDEILFGIKLPQVDLTWKGYEKCQKLWQGCTDWLAQHDGRVWKTQDTLITPEILTKIWREKALEICFQPSRLHVSLEFSDGTRTEWIDRPELCRLYKTVRIQCVHRHHNPDLTWEENKKLYYNCAYLHGHDYLVKVGLQGQVGQFGSLIDHTEFERILNMVIVEPFNFQFLNEKMGNTSGELIGEKFFSLLKDHFRSPQLYEVVVQETPKNTFYYQMDSI